MKKEQKLLNEIYSVINHIFWKKQSPSEMLRPYRLPGAPNCSYFLSLLWLKDWLRSVPALKRINR